MFKYKSLIEWYFSEPVDGKFEDITATVLNSLESDTDKERVNETEVYELQARPDTMRLNMMVVQYYI